MEEQQNDFGFEVVHFGVNCSGREEAMRQAGLFLRLFEILPAEGKDSVYAGPLVELMKGNGCGTHGHIAVAANNIHAARAYLESLGCTFDEASAKFNDRGELIVIYLKEEIAGFAVHLLQKETID
ncbi:MAG: VOC family protein [Ruminococcaceae bacterium]|nr:VOC family protein [Oscillospiraceae bacterium]